MDDARYTPIDCSLHDRLESVAVLKKQVLLRYREENGEVAEHDVRIADIVARDGIESLVLDSGARVRLDRIEAMDGVVFKPVR